MSKYNNKKTKIDNITFHSKGEAMRYLELKLLQKSGRIQGLKLQVPFVLFEKSEYGRKIKYIADFVYIKDGIEVVEDFKGFRTNEYKLKKRIFEEKYKINIFETN